LHPAVDLVKGFKLSADQRQSPGFRSIHHGKPGHQWKNTIVSQSVLVYMFSISHSRNRQAVWCLQKTLFPSILTEYALSAGNPSIVVNSEQFRRRMPFASLI